MASHPSADRIPETADLLQKMTLESQPKSAEISDTNKKTSSNPLGASNSTNGKVRPYELSKTPVLAQYVDPNTCYMPNGYFYGAFEEKDWSDYANMLTADKVEMQSSYGYAYAQYAPYSPAVSPGLEGQLYGAQQYQYPASYYQPINQKAGNTQLDTNKPAVSDQKPASGENITEKESTKITNNLGILKSSNGNSSHVSNGSASGNISTSVFPSNSYESKSVFDGVRSLWQDSPALDVQSNSKNTSTLASNKNGPAMNHNQRPNTNYMGLPQTGPISGSGTAQGFINNLYSNNLYGHYTNAYRPGMGYGVYGTYDSRTHVNRWFAGDGKYRPKGRGYGFYGYSNESADGLNELNRGPRGGKGTKNANGSTPIPLTVKGQALPTSNTTCSEKDGLSVPNNVDHYNQPDFVVEYEHAKFFIIKSYSEDDVHKSIKYNTWASTPNGNKKLDAAYREALEIAGGCPVFLFFSVNASGQFVGVAEMAGPVDFDKTLDYWQQDKWNGCFPLKWKIVKDVPNALLKHIILANIENKPVTNSRDTQEVKLEQGLQMLKIFKDHVSRTSIVDDFGFYEARQKAIQDKKAKQQQFQKQVWEGKLAAEEKDKSNDIPKLPETAPDSNHSIVKEPLMP